MLLGFWALAFAFAFAFNVRSFHVEGVVGGKWGFSRLCHKWRHMLKTQIATATTAATTTMLKMFACNLAAKTFEMLQKGRWAEVGQDSGGHLE